MKYKLAEAQLSLGQPNVLVVSELQGQ